MEEEWKTGFYESLCTQNRHCRGYSSLISEYKQLLGKSAVVFEQQRQIASLKETVASLQNEIAVLNSNGSAEIRKRLEDMEIKLHAQQERWMQKVQADAEALNQQIEEGQKALKVQRATQLRDTALRNFGQALDFNDFQAAMVPAVKKNVITAHSSDGNDLAFSPSGQMLASCSSDKDIKLWDPSGVLQATLLGHTQSVMSIDWSPNEEFLVSASNDNSLRVWRTATGQVMHWFTGHQNKVYSAKFCGDHTRAVSGSCDRTIKCWDLQRGYCTRTILCVSSCNSVASDAAGYLVASGHFDKSVKLWDVREGKEVYKIENLHAAQITHVDFSTDGSRILSLGKEGTLKITDARTYETTVQIGHRDLQVAVNWTKACFSPDSNYVVVGGQTGQVFVFDAHTGRPETVLKEHEGFVVSCAWSNVGSTVATIDNKGRIVFWGPV
eukprot:c17623_g1_i1.p1 GENE.c17623_g1_i1~~c17623_g1_i1.p1  ORF type:complete len:452 (+),score=106.13 c17623_g1_i1:37-1356(+)